MNQAVGLTLIVDAIKAGRKDAYSVPIDHTVYLCTSAEIIAALHAKTTANTGK